MMERLELYLQQLLISLNIGNWMMSFVLLFC